MFSKIKILVYIFISSSITAYASNLQSRGVDGAEPRLTRQTDLLRILRTLSTARALALLMLDLQTQSAEREVFDKTKEQPDEPIYNAFLVQGSADEIEPGTFWAKVNTNAAEKKYGVHQRSYGDDGIRRSARIFEKRKRAADKISQA